VNFDLSEEQRLLQSTIEGLLERECPLPRVRAFYDAEDDLDPAVWKGLSELGALGLHLGEAYGGAGLELLDLACVAERLGHHGTPGPFLGHVLAGLAIALGGSDAQRRAWLPRLASGEIVGSVAFAEEGERWQPEQWTLAPSGGALRGRKEHVPCGRSVGLVVVGLAGGGLGLVDGAATGLTAAAENGIDRTRRVASLAFDGAPCELLPRGAEVSTRVRDAALVLLAADAYGGAARCVELAVAYAKRREQFGRTIGHFQALKHQLANLALDTEPCRALSWYAAYAFDHVPGEAALAAAHAKSHITDRFVQVARATVEAHGGIGYTWECEVHYWLKRAVFDRSFLGSPRVHRLRAADLAGY
jgi:alkylation response protein AidB-like acyl-CoA dehydrogenase